MADTPAEATGGQEIPVTPIEENPPPITPPDYKYEEISKPEMSEIARSEPPVEEKAAEPIVEDVPLEEVGKKIAEEAAQAVLDKQQAETQALEDAKKAEEAKPQTEKERVYEEWATKFNNDNSRPPTYLEAMQFVEEQAIATIEERQRIKVQEEVDRAERARLAQEEENKQVNTYVDDELADLYKANKLTKIQDPNNPSDQGVLERQSLFAKWAEINNQRRGQGLPDIISATRIAEFYWTKPNAQPPGADAPVMGSRSATTSPNEEQEYSNADLKKPWSWFKPKP